MRFEFPDIPNQPYQTEYFFEDIFFPFRWMDMDWDTFIFKNLPGLSFTVERPYLDIGFLSMLQVFG